MADMSGRGDYLYTYEEREFQNISKKELLVRIQNLEKEIQNLEKEIQNIRTYFKKK